LLQLQARSAGKLPARGDWPPDGPADYLEGQLEDVMEYEYDAFSRAQPLEHHEKGEPHLVIEGDPVQWIVTQSAGNSIAGQPVEGGRVSRRLKAVRGRSHLVEADATGDDDQPAALVLDPARIGGDQASEGLLHRILGCSEVPDYPKRQVGEIGAVGVPCI
jgi:hypothetical protein